MKKLQVLHNLKVKGILTIFGLLFTMLFSSLLIFGAYNASQIIGHITLLLFFIPHFFIIKNMNFANRRIDFIDLDNNILYIVKSGVLLIKHEKVSFKTVSNVRAKMLVKRVGKHWSTTYEITAEVDGNDILLCTTSSRTSCNEVIDGLTKHYLLSCDFKVEGKVSKFHKTIFQNTLYEYKYAPQSYLYAGLFMLFASIYFLLIEMKLPAFIMLIGCSCSIVMYYKAKESLEKQEV